jgi:hypothetical protein
MITTASGGWVVAQEEEKKSTAGEKKDEGLPRKLSDEEKSLIEKEVERRVKEALDAAKAAAPAPQDKDQGAKIEELERKVDEVIENQKKVRPSEFNPAIGLVGETIFSYRSRGSDQTGSGRPGGFDVFLRSVELNVAASVDPFAKGWAVINASADPVTGEASLGVEEAALATTSLPWNLTLTAGRFFAEFGRLGNIHDHELPFVNRPLPLAQYEGGETRTDGFQLNWLAPIDYYLSFTAGVGTSFGGDTGPNFVGPKRDASELNYWARISTYIELAEDWQFETGISGLLNPRSDGRGNFSPATLQPDGSTITETRRALVDLDLRLSWVPLVNNQFTSLVWGTEILWSRDRFLMDPDGSLNTGVASGDEFTRAVGSLGLYSYITYKWDRQWSGGVLVEYVQNAENKDAVTSAYSGYITWATSHWNQIRIQFTRTEQNPATGLKDDNAIYIQWAWIIGAHSHGWAQR